MPVLSLASHVLVNSGAKSLYSKQSSQWKPFHMQTQNSTEPVALTRVSTEELTLKGLVTFLEETALTV